jgi:membrane-associated phospholipid phosphatase
MVTYYLYQILKHNLKIIAIFDFLRDSILFLSILVFCLWILKESFKNKKVLWIFAEFLLAIFLSILMVQLIKANYISIRPISYFYPGEQLFDSFPSQHVTLMTAISAVILNNFLEWGILMFILTLLVSIFSWLSLMHWPIDIIVGLLLGYLIGVVAIYIVKLFYRLKRK